MTSQQISQRLSTVSPYSPNYFGPVPADYTAVVEALPRPSIESVESYLADCDLDGAIAAAYYDLLPAGYDGVAIDVR